MTLFIEEFSYLFINLLEKVQTNIMANLSV